MLPIVTDAASLFAILTLHLSVFKLQYPSSLSYINTTSKLDNDALREISGDDDSVSVKGPLSSSIVRSSEKYIVRGINQMCKETVTNVFCRSYNKTERKNNEIYFPPKVLKENIKITSPSFLCQLQEKNIV